MQSSKWKELVEEDIKSCDEKKKRIEWITKILTDSCLSDLFSEDTYSTESLKFDSKYDMNTFKSQFEKIMEQHHVKDLKWQMISVNEVRNDRLVNSGWVTFWKMMDGCHEPDLFSIWFKSSEPVKKKTSKAPAKQYDDLQSVILESFLDRCDEAGVDRTSGTKLFCLIMDKFELTERK